MNGHAHHRRALRASALVEVMVSTAVMAVVSSIVFSILNSGSILFAKNTAVNMAHQQARIAVLTMEEDLHSAVSIPQLADADRAPVVGSGPAAGISFQVYAAGPFQVVSTAAGGQNQISVRCVNYTPKVGQRFCLPLHQTELDITAVSAGSGTGGANRTLTLASNLTRPVEVTLDNAGTATAVVVTGFITDKYIYVVKNGELRYFKPGDTVGRLLASDITAPTPFSIPATPLGAPYNRFVAAINLSTADHTTSNRGFKAANMFLNAQVPYRSKLCYYQ
jgi:hypothetical protein